LKPLYTEKLTATMIDMEKYPTRAPLANRSRLMRQLKSILSVCIICILLLLFTFTSGTMTDPRARSISKSPEFPQKIWQTWKVNPLSLEEREHHRALSWISKNPEHRYEMLTDDNDIKYIENAYGPRGLNRPDIVYIYKTITAKIVKADLLRYLIMYAEGGVYADIDVEAIRPISRFIPTQYDRQDVDMIVGVEIDQPAFAGHAILGKKSQSFCQWTFACKPRLPVMLKLIEGIMIWIVEQARRQHVPLSEVKLDFDDIIAGTGPSAFTNAILDDISRRIGYKVTWDEFHNLAESKLLAGVLVLTVEAFAAGQGHSDSGNHDGRNVLVKHHYHASSWPSAHPRFSHPYYGEVEQCNWVPECVQQWDSDTSAFNALPPSEQDNKLAIKRAREEAAAMGQDPALVVVAAPEVQPVPRFHMPGVSP
jgi:mannosyltransferase OCH1-like enzyme